MDLINLHHLMFLKHILENGHSNPISPCPNMEEKALKLYTLEMLALFNLHLHKIASNKVKVMREFPAECLAKEY